MDIKGNQRTTNAIGTTATAQNKMTKVLAVDQPGEIAGAIFCADSAGQHHQHISGCRYEAER